MNTNKHIEKRGHHTSKSSGKRRKVKEKPEIAGIFFNSERTTKPTMGFWRFWAGTYYCNKFFLFLEFFGEVDIYKTFQTKQFSLNLDKY